MADPIDILIDNRTSQSADVVGTLASRNRLSGQDAEHAEKPFKAFRVVRVF